MQELFGIVHEDGDLLVINNNKPAGLVCHPSKTGEYISQPRSALAGGAVPLARAAGRISMRTRALVQGIRRSQRPNRQPLTTDNELQ